MPMYIQTRLKQALIQQLTDPQFLQNIKIVLKIMLIIIDACQIQQYTYNHKRQENKIFHTAHPQAVILYLWNSLRTKGDYNEGSRWFLVKQKRL